MLHRMILSIMPNLVGEVIIWSIPSSEHRSVKVLKAVSRDGNPSHFYTMVKYSAMTQAAASKSRALPRD